MNNDTAVRAPLTDAPMSEQKYEALKREARELQRAIKRSPAECRDRIAYREGFANWAQMEFVIAKTTGSKT